MPSCVGYAARDSESPLTPFRFDRRDLLAKDVEIEILYCGVCHSDLHTVRNEWKSTLYPSLPGHEIVGRVTAVGPETEKFRVGDLAAVGCMVDSCGTCESCTDGLEQYCEPGFTGTYNAADPILGGHTFGGYSSHIVVTEHFVLKVPANLDPAGAAPLLCAGITTWSPLRHWNVGAGSRVGVVGLGGLGHMAVKLSHALGAHTTLFTTSPSKIADGKRLGADAVILSTDATAMQAAGESFDLIIDAVSAKHDINAYMALVKRDGTLVQVGAPDEPLDFNVFSILFRRKNFAGSLIGGIAETQEMLDFCGAHGITSDVEIIPIQNIEEAYTRMLKSDVKYRFVIDMRSLANDPALASAA